MTVLDFEPADVDAVRADGGLVHIRTMVPADVAGLRALHARASDRSLYLRFFSLSRETAEDYLKAVTRGSGRPRYALVACIRDEIVGMAEFQAVDATTAEVALLVADDRQHEGVGTLLLEHLASAARHAGIHRFIADVLAENAAMAKVFNDIGFRAYTELDHGTLRVVLDLDPAARTLAAVGDRERAADAASLRPLLAPRSVAVIGAGSRIWSVGHQVLRNILDGGFTGSVHVVNPHRSGILGVPSVPTAADLPIAPDLAVVAVPAAQVPEVVRACGERGARVLLLLLLTAGFGESGTNGKTMQDNVLATARRYGMRLVGPNCVGVANTDPAVRLNATFAAVPLPPGAVGVLSQSGAFGIAFIEAGARCGLGVSEFVSVGNKADISGNDLLLSWERDPRTRVIAMYLESIGDPQKFVRIARRVASGKPILAIKSGRTSAGQRAGQSHTAAAASSDVAVQAMFAEAGVLRVSTMREMLDAARVLTDQPPPAGPRVAIVGNSGGPGILAADAAVSAGLDVVEFDPDTQDRLRQAVPSLASAQNPVDLGAVVQPDEVAAALQVVLDDNSVDAVLTVFTTIAVSDPDAIMGAIVDAAVRSDKPLIATQVGGLERRMPIARTGRAIPVFAFPEPAAAALGVARRYGRIRAEQLTPIIRPDRVDAGTARELIAHALASGHDWLSPDQTERLLRCYRVPLCPQRLVHGADEAVAAATELGFPVALKVTGVLHKSDVGGVRLALADEDAVRRAVADFADIASAASPTLLLQPMTPGGTELIVGAVRDPQFGPMVMLGAGGVLADLVEDRAFRLAPLTADHADSMIAGLRVSKLLDGYRGRAAASRAAVRDLLVRVAALAHDLPEVAELDLNPVICNGEQVIAVDVRIRVSVPPLVRDPLVRALRGPTS